MRQYVREILPILALFVWPGTMPVLALGLPEDAAAVPQTDAPEAWLDVGYELFSRIQANHLRPGNSGTALYGLHRTRLQLDMRPAAALRFFLQGQDSRAITLAGRGAQPSDSFDVSQAFVELRSSRGWAMRVGRQELAFGDGRLIGSDAEWCHLGQTFDALRVSRETRRLRLDGFVSAPVAHLPGTWNHRIPGVGLHGLYSKIALQPTSALDLYLVWKAERGAVAESGRAGRADRYTVGFRHATALPGRLESNVEVALQRGSAGGDDIRAWAGHWELGRALGAGDNTPRLYFEYNHASGDSRSGDGVQKQFDDLFPAGHDQFGLPDPFPWSDLHSVGVSAVLSYRSQWEVRAGFRSLWPAAPDQQGWRSASQLSLSATYRASHRWSIYLGYSHLFVAVEMPEQGSPVCRPFVGVRYRR